MKRPALKTTGVAFFSSLAPPNMPPCRSVPVLLLACLCCVVLLDGNQTRRSEGFHFFMIMMKWAIQPGTRFFLIIQYNSDTHNARARTLTPLWIYVHKSYRYEHLRRLSWQILEVDKVTTGALLSTGMSPTTECTTPSWTQDLNATNSVITTGLHALSQEQFVGEGLLQLIMG